jgi:tRNA pseudouridine13 synthase
LKVPILDKEIGIEVYTTKTKGTGGKLRHFLEDFKVEEILTDGSRAQIEPTSSPQISGRGRYLVYVLVKRGYDTFQAVQTVAHKLDVDVDRIQIAGIKDAKALTAQHISVSRMLAQQAAQVKLNDLWLYPLRFSNQKIHSNILFGNQFRIAIRGINQSSSAIVEHMENVRNDLLRLGGCANFFGHQRFGTTRSITHAVGKHILLGEWENAALTYLAKPSPYEHPESRQAREQLWSTQDYDSAFRDFPPKLLYERQMLGHIEKQHKDFLGAFRRLPAKLLQLFVQAYQSYLFNKILSQRIKHGLSLKSAAEGEYVLRFDRKDYLAFPLIGYKQSVSGGEQGEIENQILQQEDVTPRNFRISALPTISSPGGLRTALTPLIGLNLREPSKDTVNIGKRMASLGFTLKKGSYATVVLREFMKPRNPVDAGF